MHKILVTGGSGFIGSHTILDLVEKGFDVISVDNFVNSSSKSIETINEITGKRIKNYNIDLKDTGATERIFKENKGISGIVHFAALKSVEESVQNPILYFDNNIKSLLNVYSLGQKYGVKAFVFSSSCTVYGDSAEQPVTEMTEKRPAQSPYGRTKQIGESILYDCQDQSDMKAISLRYFNPAGAHSSGRIGESPVVKAVNLVPVITETAAGLRDKCTVYGGDYDTRDGSCIRDFVHVMDLADAHEKALSFVLDEKAKSNYEVFNLGLGEGVSVLEAIGAFEQISGLKLNYEIGPRRPGDIVSIYADRSKAEKILKWKPQYNIKDIMESAWLWQQNKAY